MKCYVKDYHVYQVLSGKFGNYCKREGFNCSESNMLKLGYVIKDLSAEEIKSLKDDLYNSIKKEIEIETKLKLIDRAKQVEICLNNEPVVFKKAVDKNPYFTYVCNLSGSGLDNVYSDCGKGTAYIRDNKIIAWHYGYKKPTNAPSNCIIIKVDISCHELLFL